MSRAPRHLIALASIVTVAAASVVVAPEPAVAFEYVRNGGFEDGVDGWMAAGATATLDSVDAGVVPPYAGARSGRVSVADPLFIVRASVERDAPAGEYAFSVRVRAPSPVDVLLEVRIVATGETTVARGTAGPAGWTLVAGRVQLLGASDLAFVIAGPASSAGDTIYLDDAHIEGAPPASPTPTPTAPAADTPVPAATATATPLPTGTRTARLTRTPTMTRTPRATATVDAVTAAIRNPGFEEMDAAGGPAFWHKVGGTLDAVADPAHGGARAARLASGTAGSKWLYQAVTVQPGAPYEFSAWVLVADAAVESAYLRVSWYAADDASGSALGSADSTEQIVAPAAAFRALTTGGIAAPPGARSARLRVLLTPRDAAPAAIYVDDASWVPADAAAAPSAPVPDSAPGAGTPTTPSRAVLGAAERPGAAGASGAPGGRIVINEVLYDAAGRGADAAGEWVELYNAGDAAQPLAGWHLDDAASSETLPAISVPPRGYVVLASAPVPGASAEVAVLGGGRIGNGLGNDGDRLVLRDSSGAVVDAVSWGSDTFAFNPAVADVPAGHSIERRAPGLDTDAAADFVDNESPSPGRAIAAPPTPAATRAAAAAATVPVVTGRSHASRAWLVWPALAALAGASSAAAAVRFVPPAWRALRTRRP